MNGRAWPRIWRLSPLLLAAAVTGCGVDAPPPAPTGPLTEASDEFDATTVGDVAGCVTWAGDLPDAPPFQAPVSPLCEQVRGAKRSWPNPNAPSIDPKSRGVADAVVFLRGVDPRRARPWDLNPVRVELRDYQMHVRQGDVDGFLGFVRRGEKIDLESKQNVFHGLQGRGGDFFALTFPEQGTARTRILDRKGIVELSSSSGQFWMHAYLFVDDQPYYTRTAANGRFTLPKTPPGDYEIVVWMPDWRVAEHEIDADTRLVKRVTFRPPLQVVRPVHIDPAAKTTMNFTLSLDALGTVKRSDP